MIHANTCCFYFEDKQNLGIKKKLKARSIPFEDCSQHFWLPTNEKLKRSVMGAAHSGDLRSPRETSEPRAFPGPAAVLLAIH